MILKNHASTSARKERSSPTSKARREASRNEFDEKSEMPDRDKRFMEVDSNKNRPRARAGLVEPIGNELRKKPNLIKCRLPRAETALAGKLQEEE